MGCDIHLIVEKKMDDGSWRFVDPPERVMISFWRTDGSDLRWTAWYDSRNYGLFAVLADVRNYDRTGDHWKSGEKAKTPIAAHRGYPSDLSKEGKQFFYLDEGDDGRCTGNHSATWYTVKELLDFDWDQTAGYEGGNIMIEQYKEWKATGKPPNSYCGSRGGGNFELVSNEEMDRRIVDGTAHAGLNTNIRWPETYREAAGERFLNFLHEISCGQYSDRVRIVMDFDN